MLRTTQQQNKRRKKRGGRRDPTKLPIQDFERLDNPGQGGG